MNFMKIQAADEAGRNAQPALPASIELSPKQAAETDDWKAHVPKGVRVYITDLGGDDARQLAGARRLNEAGYVAVPHIAARRCRSARALDDRIRALTQEAGVLDVLVIGGGLGSPAGDFSSSMDVLGSGILDRWGIRHVGIAGHPEGSPDFVADAAWEALRLKAEFAKRSAAELRIVTQFAFDGKLLVRWAQDVERAGIGLPIHLGIAGPAKLTTLLKYAMTCGVGNSIDFLRKRAASLSALVTTHSPEVVVEPVEMHAAGGSGAGIAQLHVFPFGGLVQSAAWLKSRGSWTS